MRKSWVFPVQNMCSICGDIQQIHRIFDKQWKKYSVFRFFHTGLHTMFAHIFSPIHPCLSLIVHTFHTPYNNQLLFKTI